MPRTVNDRIAASFADDDRESLAKYLDWLRSTISEYNQSLRRSVALSLALMAIFELITEAPNTAFTIVSFHITKSSIAFLFLPALVAYLYLQTFIDTNRGSDTERAFSITFNKWLPLSKSNDLDVLALPSQPLLVVRPVHARS